MSEVEVRYAIADRWVADAYGIWHGTFYGTNLRLCHQQQAYLHQPTSFVGVSGEVRLPPDAWVCPLCAEVIVKHEITRPVV